MKRLYALMIFCLMVALSASAQLGATTVIRHSGTLPTTCSGGDIYIKSGTSAGFYYNIGSGACSWVDPSASGGGGLSGQTTNYLPLATSSTGSTTSSIVEQIGTTEVEFHTTGTARGWSCPEGTSLTPTAGSDIFNCNSTTHTMDLSNNGGAFSPICTAANGLCSSSGPTTPNFEGYTYVVDSTAASVTSPSMSVTAGELLVVSCRFGTGSTGTATDSAGNSYTALTAQTNGSVNIQMSWALAATTASITFTCTQSSSVAGLSLVASHYSNVGTAADASAGGSSFTTGGFLTTQKAVLVYCSAVGALTSWALVNPGTWYNAGVAGSAINSTTADQGCAWTYTNAAIYAVATPMGAGSGSGPVSTVLAFRW